MLESEKKHLSLDSDSLFLDQSATELASTVGRRQLFAEGPVAQFTQEANIYLTFGSQTKIGNGKPCFFNRTYFFKLMNISIAVSA